MYCETIHWLWAWAGVYYENIGSGYACILKLFGKCGQMCIMKRKQSEKVSKRKPFTNVRNSLIRNFSYELSLIIILN